MREMVLEMAAKQNKRIVRGFANMLDRIFNTMFAGLDLRQEELEALRETAARPLDLLSLTPLARRLPCPELRPGQRWDDPSAGRGRESEHLSASAFPWRRRLLHSP